MDSCADNDIVLVAPGRYVENIIWPNTYGIHLISELGPEVTIIDGSNPSNPDSGSVVLFGSQQDTTTVLYGFTIINGTGTFAPSFNTTLGGGLYCCNGSSPSIIDNVITTNSATWGGGGIGCTGSSPIIRDNTIYENGADTVGGGILAYSSSHPTIEHNIINNNTARWAGGIYIVTGSNPIITDNDILRNEASYSAGGGLGIAWSSAPTLQYNNIIGNKAAYGGGGIYCTMYSTPIIMNCTIENDTAIAMYGGGIRIRDNASTTVKHTTISNNQGAGISCTAGGTAIVDSCVISNNSYNGIYCYENGNTTINRCQITDNVGYAVNNLDPAVVVNAEYNWWGDSTGPYHPDSNPGGLGDSVSDYVDFIPWLYWPGVEEHPIIKLVERHETFGATIFAGPLQLPEGKNCKIFDITGRVVLPQNIKAGIYFIEVDGKITRKVVKVR